VAAEQAVDLAPIDRPHLPAHRASFVGDRAIVAAAIAGGRLAADQSGALQPIREPRQVALREHDARSELVHPQPAIVDRFEGPEDVVPGERRQAGFLQCRLHAVDEARVRLEKYRPGVTTRGNGGGPRHRSIGVTGQLAALCVGLVANATTCGYS